MTDRVEGRQNAVIHEGAPSDEQDTNERADQAVEIQQPDGSPAPRAEEHSKD